MNKKQIAALVAAAVAIAAAYGIDLVNYVCQ